MKSMFSMLFQSPGLLSILSHRQIYPKTKSTAPIAPAADSIELSTVSIEPETEVIEPETEVIEPAKPLVKRIKNPKGLSVKVDMSYLEVITLHTEAIRIAKEEASKNEFEYYKAYLRQMIPTHEDYYDEIVSNLSDLRHRVEDRLVYPKYREILLVERLLRQNNYVCKNTRRPGLIVKMFHTHYYGQDVFVKVYLYDPNCESYRSSFTENFKNEVIFQSYAKQLNEYIDFISPGVYSWGRIRKYVFDDEEYPFECLFMIMEYIPFVTLKEAVYSTEHMRNIYERVEQIDTELSWHLIHHNDLHSRNIMVSDKSPSSVGDKSPHTNGNNKSPHPEIVILDFGEASLGPKKPIFRPWKI